LTVNITVTCEIHVLLVSSHGSENQSCVLIRQRAGVHHKHMSCIQKVLLTGEDKIAW